MGWEEWTTEEMIGGWGREGEAQGGDRGRGGEGEEGGVKLSMDKNDLSHTPHVHLHQWRRNTHNCEKRLMIASCW